MPTRSLSIAAYGTLGYAVIGPVFCGTVTHLHDSVWQSTSPPIVVAVLLMGLLMPTVLIVALVHAVPPPVERSMAQGELLAVTPDGDGQLIGVVPDSTPSPNSSQVSAVEG